MDEYLFETDPRNLIPVTNAELEEKISATKKFKKRIQKKNKEEVENNE